MNQSAIRMAPTAATRVPRYPRNRSPRRSNNRNMKIAINERYKVRKKDLRQLGAPMFCRHFGHGNESGRDRLPPVLISVHRKELLHIGQRGTSGRNSIATGQTIHSSTSTTKIGHAISGAGYAKAIATCQPLMRQTLHHKTIAFCGNWIAPCLQLGPGKRRFADK